jgi:hypothetical protein
MLRLKPRNRLANKSYSPHLQQSDSLRSWAPGKTTMLSVG